MNTSTLTCIGFVQSLNKNYTDAVDTFHKALGQKREDTFSSTMLTCVLDMCIDDPHFNDYFDEEDGEKGDESKKKDVLKLNDDNDVIIPFRNPKFRLWNRKVRKPNSSSAMEEDNSAIVIDSNSTVENSGCSMDLSTQMSENSDSFK